MKSTKGLLLIAVVLFSSLFIAFTGNSTKDAKMTQKQRLLQAIAEMLEKQHYSPQTINDDFSKKVFKKYLNDLDADKLLFLQEDIAQLKKFETKLDEEMHGGDIGFLPALNPIYDKRTDDLIKLYKQILNKPFDFTIDEQIIVDNEKQDFAKDQAEQADRIRKKLKYLTLERYTDLLETRNKSTVDSVKNQSDAALEKEAREKVLKQMDRVYNRIKAKFNEEERFNTYINTITNLMDPHTDFFPPVEKRAFDEQMSGRFFGIGAQLQEQDGTIKIASILTGGPAWKQGELIAGDVILKVAQATGEAVDIAGYEVTDAVKLIRGTKGTEVKLTIKRQDGTVKTLSLIRDEIVQDESFARSAIINENGKKIGYIYLPDFYANFEDPNGARCSQDVAKEIIKLKSEKIDGIVMDLRFNGGGSLYEVVQMVGLFIPEGPVVQVRGKDGKASILKDENSSVLYDGPLAVMVNEGSASASEIFAAAIQDYKRGVIIGSTSTYGKGTVQRNLPLGKRTDFFGQSAEFGAVKLTFQKFYRINGGSTQLKGVSPDVVLPDVYEYLKIREKDNPSSLAWDEIAKAPYTTSKEAATTDAEITKAKATVEKNQLLNIVKNNTTWLEKNIDAPKSLKLTTYIEQQKNIKATVTQNNTITKLKNELNVSVLKEDYDKFYNNSDKPKGERYQAWLRNIKSDIYIDQTAKIITEMSNAAATAKN